MLKKEEVYLRVSSEKKARKMASLLDMFGEKVYGETLERLKNGIVSDEYPYVSNFCNDWAVLIHGRAIQSLTKVSLKELKNILAREHLKEGDVVVLEDGGEKSLCEFERISNVFEGQYRSHKFCELDGTGLELYGGIHKNFIRYATEEEKQLLKPEESVIDKAISLLQHGLGLDYSHEVIQGLEELKNK